MRAFLVLLVSLAAPFSLATASCYQPSEPVSYVESLPYSKPTVPYCLSGYSFSGSHTCSEWEIDSYFDEIDAYTRKVIDYANSVAETANMYLQFSEDARAFAKCEIERVRHQHE